MLLQLRDSQLVQRNISGFCIIFGLLTSRKNRRIGVLRVPLVVYYAPRDLIAIPLMRVRLTLNFQHRHRLNFEYRQTGNSARLSSSAIFALIFRLVNRKSTIAEHLF